MSDVESKGVGLRSFVKTTERLLGAEVADRIRARLPADLRAALRDGLILPSGWYPIAWHRALHRAAREETGRGRELARLIGREAARDDFRGIYRFVASLLSAQTIIRQGGRLFGNYFKGGTFEVAARGPTGAELHLRGCNGFDANLWENVLGGVESALDVVGARDVVITVDHGGENGDATLDGRASWRA